VNKRSLAVSHFVLVRFVILNRMSSVLPGLPIVNAAKGAAGVVTGGIKSATSGVAGVAQQAKDYSSQKLQNRVSQGVVAD
jgi:hypothetical protein